MFIELNRFRLGMPIFRRGLASTDALRNISQFYVQCRYNTSAAAVTAIFENEPIPNTSASESNIFGMVRGVRNVGPDRKKFGNVDFFATFNTSQVKEKIGTALAEKESSEPMIEAIRACGSSWFDTNYVEKNAIVDRFVDNHLLSAKLDLPLANAVLRTYVENNKKIDPKTYLAKLLNAGLHPDADIYSAMIQLECNSGSFKSALSIFNFMQSKNLPMSETMLVSLVAASISEGQTDSTHLFIKELENLKSNVFIQKFAIAYGYSKIGNLDSIAQVIPNEKVKAQGILHTRLLIYKSLVESGHSDAASEYLRKMESRNAVVQPYDTVAAHLYANGFDDAALELNTVASGLPSLWNQTSSRLINSVVVRQSNTTSDIVNFCDKLSASHVAEEGGNYLANAVGKSFVFNGKNSAELVDQYITKTESLQKHFILPWMKVQSDISEESLLRLGNILQSSEVVPTEAFCKELVRLFKGSPKFETILANMDSTGKLQSFLTRYYIEMGHWNKAAKHARSYKISTFESDNIMFSIVDAFKMGDICVSDAASIVNTCCDSNPEDTGKINRLLQAIQPLLDTEFSKRLYFSLIDELKTLKCYAKEVPVYESEQMRFEGYREMSWMRRTELSLRISNCSIVDPSCFVKSGEFPHSILLSENKHLHAGLLQELEAQEQTPEVKWKKIILHNASGNFGPVEEALASDASLSDTNLIRSILITKSLLPAKPELAFEFFKSCYAFGATEYFARYFHGQTPVLTELLNACTTEDQLKSIGDFIFSDNRYQLHVKPYFQRLREFGSSEFLKSEAERVLEHFDRETFGLGAYLSHLTTVDLNKAYDFRQEYAQKGIMLTQDPLIFQCIVDGSDVAREVLKKVLDQNTMQSASWLTGGVIIKYLSLGKYEKAETFAKGKDFYIPDTRVFPFLKEFGDPAAFVAFIKVTLANTYRNRDFNNGKVEVLLNFLRKVYSTGGIKEGEKEFVTKIVAAIVESKVSLRASTFVNLYNLALCCGVEMPESSLAENRTIALQFRDAVYSDNLPLAKEILKISPAIYVDDVTISRFVDQVLDPVIVTLQDDANVIEFFTINKAWFAEHTLQLARVFSRAYKSELFEELYGRLTSPESVITRRMAMVAYASKLFDKEKFCVYLCQEERDGAWMHYLINQVVLNNNLQTIRALNAVLLEQPDDAPNKARAVGQLRRAVLQFRGETAAGSLDGHFGSLVDKDLRPNSDVGLADVDTRVEADINTSTEPISDSQTETTIPSNESRQA